MFRDTFFRFFGINLSGYDTFWVSPVSLVSYLSDDSLFQWFQVGLYTVFEFFHFFKKVTHQHCRVSFINLISFLKVIIHVSKFAKKPKFVNLFILQCNLFLCPLIPIVKLNNLYPQCTDKFRFYDIIGHKQMQPKIVT